MIHPFYIDKRLNSKSKPFIDVKLHHPIIANDNESLYLEIKDVQYVNNLYNISNYLQNNEIMLGMLNRIYNIVNITGEAGSETIIDIAGNLYDPTLTTLEKYKESTILNYNTTDNIFKISNTKYDMEYLTPSLTNGTDPFIIPLGFAINHYNNIFIDDANNKLDFKPDTNSLIFTNKSAGWDLLKNISYKIHYNGSASINVDFTFTLKIEGSNDKIIWTNIPSLIPDSLDVTWANGETTQIKGVDNVNLNNYQPYKYYKLTLLRSESIAVQNTAVYDSFKLNFLELKKTSYNVTYTEIPNNTTLTIPDGFYKASNYISTINSLLEEYNIAITHNSINNKIDMIYTNNFIPSYLGIDMGTSVTIYLKSTNQQINLGSESNTITLIKNIKYYLENGVNLINSQKIILTTNLELENNSHNEIIGGNNLATGLGDIVGWIPNDIPPLSCVNYENIKNSKYKIKNKQISNIIFYIYNEKSQQIALDNMLISFNIIKL